MAVENWVLPVSRPWPVAAPKVSRLEAVLPQELQKVPAPLALLTVELQLWGQPGQPAGEELGPPEP
jgi:hypothetical protein